MKGKSEADLDPTEWGWTLKTGKLLPIEMSKPPVPIEMSKPPVPDFLLKLKLKSTAIVKPTATIRNVAVKKMA